MESFQDFRKLWGRISQDLPPDTYTIKVKNNYNVTSFNGQKSIVLANSSPIGTGVFFGYVLLIGAGLALTLITVLYILKKKNENRVYTIHDLKWN